MSKELSIVPEHLEERWRVFQTLPETQFQVLLFDWIIKYKPSVVVETGINKGIGSYWILRALELYEGGRLISVELNPKHRFKHDLWRARKGFSHEHLIHVFIDVGPWDLFIHDSDHEVGCTTYEYELAWSLTKPGGFIATDDAAWGVPPHFSWRKFCERHAVTSAILGSLEMIQKPVTADKPIVKDNAWLQRQHWLSATLANEACKEYGCEPYIKL